MPHRPFSIVFSPRFTFFLIIAFGSLASVVGCNAANDVEPASMVIYNGKVVTDDDTMPEANGIVINGDRIDLVGSNTEVEAYIGPGTKVIDLQGNLAIPGFIEGHGHFMGIGSNVLNLDLLDATSWQGVADMVATAVAEAQPGQLIEGRGWHQEKMEDLDESNTVR